MNAPRSILHFVPYQIECPRCAKTGLVRVEHVIKAGSATRTFYCGACEHQWSLAEPGQPIATPPPPLPKPRTRSYGPKRRG
jgi:transcription elongation factor Elf1